MVEIIEKFNQNFATVFWNTNQLTEGLYTYDLPPINANESNINLLNMINF